MAAWPTALFSVLYKVSYAVSLLLVVLVILCAVVSSAPGLTLPQGQPSHRPWKVFSDYSCCNCET